MTELGACPFCSGERVDYDSLLFTQKGKVIYAKCPDCGTSFRVLEHVYNHRPIEVRQAREVAELRDKCLAQAAEIAKLELDLLQAGRLEHELNAIITAKDAEIERLQNALDRIIDVPNTEPYLSRRYDTIIDIARAARESTVGARAMDLDDIRESSNVKREAANE